DPNYLEALFDYADSCQNAAEGDASQFRGAVNAWKQLIELESSNLEAQDQLMELYFAAKYWPEAQAAANRILQKIEDKRNSGQMTDPELKKKALIIKAQTQLILRDNTEAQKTLDVIIGEFPNEFSARLLYLQMLNQTATESEPRSLKQVK